MSVLVFDGDCAFCTMCARWAVAHVHSAAQAIPYQHADLPKLGLTVEGCASALHYVDHGGQAHRGADAVGRYLQEAAGWWRIVGSFMLLPGIHNLSQIVYRVIAENRHRLPGGTAACASHLHE